MLKRGLLRHAGASRMSIKKRLAHINDLTRLAVLERLSPRQTSRISLLPVFHVEKLYNDSYHDSLCQFLEGYRALTGKRAVITCMTPHSPILAQQIKETGFSVERYWDRIEQAAENGIVGLHGHFVRAPLEQGLRPMHHAFHNLDLIRDQISCELNALRAHELVNEQLLIYSGGWWFMTPGLRDILAQLGFHWDYSLSSSRFNISPGSAVVQMQATSASGSYSDQNGQQPIRSAIAVSGLARGGRPYQAISKIMAEVPSRTSSTTYVSLYSHDYDLELEAAMQMTKRFCEAGFYFHEPTPAIRSTIQ